MGFVKGVGAKGRRQGRATRRPPRCCHRKGGCVYTTGKCGVTTGKCCGVSGGVTTGTGTTHILSRYTGATVPSRHSPGTRRGTRGDQGQAVQRPRVRGRWREVHISSRARRACRPPRPSTGTTMRPASPASSPRSYRTAPTAQPQPAHPAAHRAGQCICQCIEPRPPPPAHTHTHQHTHSSFRRTPPPDATGVHNERPLTQTATGACAVGRRGGRSRTTPSRGGAERHRRRS